MNTVNQYGEKRNGFAEVLAFCYVTSRYFDRFLLQVDRNRRQTCFFYLAPVLICEEYWQVNCRRSIFRIADPNTVRTFMRLLEEIQFFRISVHIVKVVNVELS